MYLHRPIGLAGLAVRAANPFRWLEYIRWQRGQTRLIRRGWYDPSARSDDPAVFIGGCLRSGTTLLREILHRHPRLTCGLETTMLAPPFDVSRIASYYQLDGRTLRRRAECSQHLVDFAEKFYGDLLIKENKRRWVDKATGYVRVIGRLLTWFPRGRFIHMVRDGRDVACSLRDHPREVVENGTLVPRSMNRPIRDCAGVWLGEASMGLTFQSHPRCLEVRYERLVAEPSDEMRRVCAFLGEEFCPSILEADNDAAVGAPPARFATNHNAAGPISQASIGRWRSELSRDERIDFDNVAGELLIALGYTDTHEWTAV